jgi:hypothetical protein
MKRKLANEALCIERDAIVNNDNDILCMNDFINEEDGNMLDNTSSINLVHAAVLPKPSLIGKGVNEAVQALADVILPDDDTKELRNEFYSNPSIVAVTRNANPLTEWDENDILFSSVFAHLFMLGKGLPKGPIPKAFLRHLFLHYDGRFEDPLFIATAFNQLQRHKCIRQTAFLGTTKRQQLENLGILAKSPSFRESLEWARDNPLSNEAKKLNAKICRIMSMVGSSVPFSPFERASIRPKLEAMRFRYGIASVFITGAPPEFEDTTCLRVALIKKWNVSDCSLAHASFSRKDFPSEFRKSVSARIELMRTRSALAAMCYMRKVQMLMKAVIRCPLNQDTRCSRDYLMRQRGAYLSVAACNGVTEPQGNGRLHWHMNIYASALTPSLLTRLVAAPEYVKTDVASTLDSMCCTHLSYNVRKWFNGLECTVLPTAFELTVPNASENFAGFLDCAQQKASLIGHHKHGFTCQKPPKGLYMCRLCMGRGIHERPTSPLIIAMHTRPDHKLHKRAILSGYAVDKATLSLIDGSYRPLDGQLIRPHSNGPVVWELHRPSLDTMFVETNLLTTNLIGCHNNSSLISGQDAGEAVEEYECAYMTKEGAPLRQAASILLSALDDIALRPSIAEDVNSSQRTGKHLASRTVNAFIGSHQWSMPLMVHALLGYTSRITTDSFRYVFPHAAVSYVDYNKGMLRN